jgi:hypothetical protein
MQQRGADALPAARRSGIGDGEVLRPTEEKRRVESLSCSTDPSNSLSHILIMNSRVFPRPVISSRIQGLAVRRFGSTPVQELAMKPGTTFQGLSIFKGQEPPVVKERAEYPEWVDTLADPMLSLAKLRRIPNEEAQDRDILRYLKLKRRLTIKQKNEESAI